MLKLLYLLFGVAISQTVAEANVLVREYVDYLKKLRESITTYRPVPALERGSAEAHRVIQEHKHRENTAGEAKVITKKIRNAKLILVVVYGTLTLALGAGIVCLETAGCHDEP